MSSAQTAFAVVAAAALCLMGVVKPSSDATETRMHGCQPRPGDEFTQGFSMLMPEALSELSLQQENGCVPGYEPAGP